MKAPVEDCEALLRTCEAQGDSPPIALMKLIIATEDAAFVERVLHRATGSPYADRVTAVMKQNAAGCVRVAAMLASGVDNPPENGTVEEGIRFCRRLFDWSVTQSEEASVALYSFGNPALLHQATREIAELFAAWGLLGQDRVALDIGCGIGRLEEGLASKLLHLTAIDVSEAMTAAARRRCIALSNVSVRTASGQDLRDHASASFDLVFAVDTFPYLVQSGMALVETHFAEVRRVLRGGGDFVILDFSYSEEPGRDQEEVARLAADHHFDVLVAGSRPFSLWNGKAFRLRARRS
jgi:cyclopropane fatty-acyl-phospholipid synthase-like methyltransferase